MERCSSRFSMGVAAFALACAVVALGPTAGVAQEDEAEAEAEAVEEESEGPNRGRVSLTLQNDFTNAYFFRGILNERDGFIWQPALDVGLNVYASEDGPLRSLDLGMGVWNSFHSKQTLAENSPSNLYETDWYPSIAFGFAGGVTFTSTYYFYTSPNGAFDTVQELELLFEWDDSEVLGRFALAPWVLFALETERTSLGDEEGQMVAMGIAPTLYEHDDERFPISLALPIELGLSIDEYYEEPDRGQNDTFGYLAWGLTATLPLGCIPEDFGSWSLALDGRGYYFSNALARANRGDRLYPVVTGSVILEY